MIKKYVSNIATQMGMKPPNVSLVEGHSLGCIDTHLVNISTKGRIVGALIFNSDLESLAKGEGSDRLEIRIRSSLARLQMLLEALE